MNLIIDIGNTRAKLFAFEGNQLVSHCTCDYNLSEIGHFIEKNACTQGILSTTAKLTNDADRHIEELPFKVLRMTGTTPTPVQVKYHTPETLGTDRLAAVVGAQALCPGRDILVIDCGTCVTYDLLDAEGCYWGGNISPGLGMRFTALHRQTARLPLIDAEGDLPEVGYDTQTAIRSGVIQGLQYEIKGYIGQLKQRFPALSVFLTGGDAKKLDISEECCIFADDFIVPRGLNLILNYNK